MRVRVVASVCVCKCARVAAQKHRNLCRGWLNSLWELNYVQFCPKKERTKTKKKRSKSSHDVFCDIYIKMKLHTKKTLLSLYNNVMYIHSTSVPWCTNEQ